MNWNGEIFTYEETHADEPQMDTNGACTGRILLTRYPWMEHVLPNHEPAFFQMEVTVDLFHLKIKWLPEV